MATERVFYVVDWILENQFSVISTKDIVSPVKDIYEENEEITAKWGRGKSVYPARIVKKSGKLSKWFDFPYVILPNLFCTSWLILAWSFWNTRDFKFIKPV